MHQCGCATWPLPFDNEICGLMHTADVRSIGMTGELGVPLASTRRAWTSVPCNQTTAQFVPVPGSPPTSADFWSTHAFGLIWTMGPTGNGDAASSVRLHTEYCAPEPCESWRSIVIRKRSAAFRLAIRGQEWLVVVASIDR